MADNFASQIDLARAIAAEIDTLTDEFGPDAASHVENHRKEALELVRQDPRFQATATAVGKSRIALRQQRVDVARKLQSNGVKENERTLNARLWTSGGYQRVTDYFVGGFQPSEKLIRVGWWDLQTNLRTRTRAELKRECRTVTELNTARFESQFISDADIHAAAAIEKERETPTQRQYGFQGDFPSGYRPRA